MALIATNIYSNDFSLDGYWRIHEYKSFPLFNGMTGCFNESTGEGYVYHVPENDYHFEAGQLWYKEIVKDNDSTYSCQGMFRYTNGNHYYGAETISVINSNTIKIFWNSDPAGMIFKRVVKTDQQKTLTGTWTIISTGDQDAVFWGMQGEVKDNSNECVVTRVNPNSYGFIDSDIWWKDFSEKSDTTFDCKNLWRWTDGYTAYGEGTITFLGDDFILTESTVERNGITTTGFYYLLRENDKSVVTVYDTVHVTVYDTISVTDTLIIDVTISSLPDNEINSIIKVYPNPTNDIVNIDFGNNYQSLDGYKYKIISSLGQIIIEENISVELSTLNISSFGKTGLYYIQIIDKKNTVIDVKKILLQ